MPRPLNPKQLKFIAHYLAGDSATQAYVKAGYKGRGRTAENNASRMLGNAGVKEAISVARSEANENNGITAKWYAERVKLESERTGPGSSHAARVSALKLAADLLGVAEKHEIAGKDGGPIQHEHSGTVTARIEHLAAAFAGAADREEAGGVPGDGARKPVDS